MKSNWFLVPLVLLNAVPVYGVFNWGWQSFDLIFLYWFENLVIGFFTLARFVVRPYKHFLDLFVPLFFAPFFALHYGMFCTVHGSFVISVFGDERVSSQGFFEVYGQIPGLLGDNYLLFAAAAFVLLQLMDWIMDSMENGPRCDNVKDLMTQPYRRIIVLHLTIIGSGFALGTMDEPLSGLILLIVLKIAFDIYHWHKDELRGAENKNDILLNPEMLEKMNKRFPEPSVKVNGKENSYGSFEELKNSNHYRMMTSVLRLMGSSRDIKAIEAYMDMKISEEGSK